MWTFRRKSISSNTKAINKLIAARLMADTMGVPTLMWLELMPIRQFINSATLMKEMKIYYWRTATGFYVEAGIEQGIDRGLS